MYRTCVCVCVLAATCTSQGPVCGRHVRVPTANCTNEGRVCVLTAAEAVPMVLLAALSLQLQGPVMQQCTSLLLCLHALPTCTCARVPADQRM
jgi:hypothetical protein